jgi:hypothetical protein
VETGRTPAASLAAREASMYEGLILAVLIGLGVAWLFTRIRRRMGMPVNGKHWLAAVVVFVVVIVLAYGASHTPH